MCVQRSCEIRALVDTHEESGAQSDMSRITNESEAAKKLVAGNEKSVLEEDVVASSEEVAELTERFNQKYEKAFRALAN